MSAWKALELRVAKALGGSRTGPAGKAVSDIVGTPWAVECKRSKASFRVAWIEQAIAQGKRERKPWLLVVARHNDRNPICVMEFSEFLSLARDAGRIGECSSAASDALVISCEDGHRDNETASHGEDRAA